MEVTEYDFFEQEGDDFKADFWILDMIEQLLKNSSLSEERKQDIESQIESLTFTQANEILNELREKQVDRITSGLNYNQSDIIEHLRKLK